MGFLKDEEIQRNGLIFCIFNVGPQRMGFEQVPFIRVVHKIRESLPIKLMAAHYCYDDPLIYSLMFVVTMFAGSRLRARFKAHYGTSSRPSFSLRACASRFLDSYVEVLLFPVYCDVFKM